jgi:hypothetical protein
MFPDTSGVAELQHVSSIYYAGMTFSTQGWAILEDDTFIGRQLIFMASFLRAAMVEGSATYADALFTCSFRFSFEQLGVKIDANRLIVDAQRMQSLLDYASSETDLITAEFMPPQCQQIRGRWTQTVEPFECLAMAKMLRSVHLGRSSAEELIFTVR